MSERRNVSICEGVNISYINEKKFTTSRVSFTMFVPLEKGTAAVNALLMGIMERGCRKYPDFESFNRYLEQLYGANIFSNVDKIGEVQALTISAVCINNHLGLNREDIVSNVSKLLRDVIFDPCADNGTFKSEDINQAKRQLKESIRAEYNDKKLYAKLRCEELMCKNEKFSINKLGREEDIDKIEPSDIYRAWQQLLQSAKIEIMALGDIDFDKVCRIFSDAFSKIERKNVSDYASDVIKTVSEVREFKDCLDVVQCKLVMGFRSRYSVFTESIFPIKVMTSLLGGTPNSKLFLHVREELSLCYYCAAGFNNYKGILLIESGVEKDNLERAKKEILNQLDCIKKGNFTEDELDDTKKYLVQAFEKIDDSLSALNGWYVSQAVSPKVYTPQEYIRHLNGVTRDEVIEAANDVTLDTIYTLTGKEGNK